jgi:hypothetical protein
MSSELDLNQLKKCKRQPFNNTRERCKTMMRKDDIMCTACARRHEPQTQFPSKFNSNLILDITI